MILEEILFMLRGGLIVSCQARAGSPLARPEMIAALALTAELNGAVGVRIDGPDNLRAVCSRVSVPVIGIEKLMCKDSDVYITPTYASAARVAGSGAHVIALDATQRPRLGGETVKEIIATVHASFGRPVMADVATYADGIAAVEEMGADLVSTTLSGYTAETSGHDGPDLILVEQLAQRLKVPVICEGRLNSAGQVRRAFDVGAFAVVIGTAITGVDWLARHFAGATPKGSIK